MVLHSVQPTIVRQADVRIRRQEITDIALLINVERAIVEAHRNLGHHIVSLTTVKLVDVRMHWYMKRVSTVAYINVMNHHVVDRRNQVLITVRIINA